ncbi:GIY-YIG nuclease family protein, partial [Carboxylicivirga linearis]
FLFFNSCDNFIVKKFHMFTVYVLFSPNFNKIYIGFTSNLNKRLLSHNEKATKGWSIKYRPWKLIYKEESIEKSDAMRREKELKSHRGRDFI